MENFQRRQTKIWIALICLFTSTNWVTAGASSSASARVTARVLKRTSIQTIAAPSGNAKYVLQGEPETAYTLLTSSEQGNSSLGVNDSLNVTIIYP